MKSLNQYDYLIIKKLYKDYYCYYLLMNNSYDKNSYIKADNNIIINEKFIRWVKQIDECLHVCSLASGCSIRHYETHPICRINNPDSYNKLIEKFNKKN